MPFEIKIDKENANVYLGSALVAFHHALRIAIRDLADINGLNDLSWFDQLRDGSIRAAKGMPTEQIPVEIEAAAIGFAVETLDAALSGLRLSLTKYES